MARPSKKQPKPTKVILDWKAYFLEFCKLHHEPVEYRGRLIFRDGWSYSNQSYEGPETQPPADPNELDQLVVTYWTLRKGQCEKILGKLLTELNELGRVQNEHSLPLMQVTLVKDKDEVRKGAIRMDLDPLNDKIRWVTIDIRECIDRLKEIEDYYRARKSNVG